MVPIQPIQTCYKGYRFRSRLEARWAVFFDALGYTWEYEKEGFDLDGVWYLPDFYLPQIDCYAEVKPTDFADIPQDERAKMQALQCIILDGVPAVRWYLRAKTMLTLSGKSFYQYIHLPYSLYKKRPWYLVSGEMEHYDKADFQRAVDAARSARFEHGEKGGYRPRSR